MISRKLGKYEILAYLGGGRFGDVYLARDTLLNAEVALKIARTNVSQASAFLHEIKVLFSLFHAHILRYHSADIIEGKLVLITEHIDGHTLREWIQKKAPIRSDEVDPILRAVASALDYAHSQNIIHRDLKPENIMLDKAGTVKLMDFGLAKFMDKDLTESIGGTPPYMAPEAWRGHHYPATDQWALAVIAVEMLAGANPFYADNLDQIRAKIMEGFKPTDFFLGLLPKESIQALTKALSSDHKNRFESCMDFVDGLFKPIPLEKKGGKLDPSYDSVIIPRVAEPGALPRPTRLSQEQLKAIDAPETRVLVIGGAGAGKTYALVAKVCDVILSKYVHPMKILIVSSTIRGWLEIENRLHKYLKLKTKDLWVGNFQHHCFQILSAHARRLGYKEGLEHIPRAFSHQRLRELERGQDFSGHLPSSSEIQDIISRLKRIMMSPVDYRPEDEAGNYIKYIWTEYQEGLKKDNLVDDDDLLVQTHRLLHENEDIQQECRGLFTHVLIDDFQDFVANKWHMEILRLLLGPDAHLFCAADDDESIVGWKSTPELTASKITESFERFAVFNLTQTFRLPQEILAPALNLIQINKDRIEKVLWSQKKPKRGEFVIRSFPTPVDEAGFAVSTIKQSIRDGEKWKDFAVLCRFRKNLKAYQEVFLKTSIPFSFLENENYFDKEEVEVLLKFLRAVTNPRASEDIEGLMKRSRLADRKAKEFLTELQNRKGSFTTLNLLKIGIDNFGLFDPRKHESEAKAFRYKADIHSFLELVEDFEETSQDKSPQALLRYLRVFRDSGLKKDEEAVKLLTIHQATGLEFPFVFLPGLVDGEFPHTKSLFSENALEEERRICYVGMTRATEALYVTYSTHRGAYKSQINRPSRFLREMIGA